MHQPSGILEECWDVIMSSSSNISTLMLHCYALLTIRRVFVCTFSLAICIFQHVLFDIFLTLKNILLILEEHHHISSNLYSNLPHHYNLFYGDSLAENDFVSTSTTVSLVCRSFQWFPSTYIIGSTQQQELSYSDNENAFVYILY